MEHRIAIVAALLVGLSACASVDTSGWPNPATLQAGLAVAEGSYTAYCAAQPSASACAAANHKKVADAETAANDALAAYAQAYASGNVTQALLDNLNKAIADVAAIVADVKGH